MNTKFEYTVYNQYNIAELSRVALKTVAIYLKRSTIMCRDYTVKGKLLDGYRIDRQVKDNSEPITSFYCQNPKCKTRLKQHHIQANYIYDDIRGELKVCRNCKGGE